MRGVEFLGGVGAGGGLSGWGENGKAVLGAGRRLTSGVQCLAVANV